MPSDAPLFCWSCQAGLTLDITVHLGDGLEIPCCQKCWSELTVEQRLKIGQTFADRANGGYLESIATIFRSSVGRFIEERGGDEWFRGRGN